MRKLLNIILVIQIIGVITEFFILLFHSVVLCIILTPISLLGIVPTIAIIKNMDDIEDLQYTLNHLRFELKQINENEKTEDSTTESLNSNIRHRETARGAWECVKCDTVNKEGTDHCSNCGSDYSPFTNPTVNPYEKKKVSRWIKEK